uniref:Uncharacterized protein n=1 Tax=Romanomermis culicivorax TaxID=13658 RepID=A0A915HHE6_ROMCU
MAQVRHRSGLRNALTVKSLLKESVRTLEKFNKKTLRSGAVWTGLYNDNLHNQKMPGVKANILRINRNNVCRKKDLILKNVTTYIAILINIDVALSVL